MPRFHWAAWRSRKKSAASSPFSRDPEPPTSRRRPSSRTAVSCKAARGSSTRVKKPVIPCLSHAHVAGPVRSILLLVPKLHLGTHLSATTSLSSAARVSGSYLLNCPPRQARDDRLL